MFGVSDFKTSGNWENEKMRGNMTTKERSTVFPHNFMYSPTK